MQRLEERAAIVTGSGDGIGRRIALAFAREGARVLIVDIKENIHETAQQIEAEVGAGRAFPLLCDIGEGEGVLRCVEVCVAQFGRLDCVVNNAADQTHFHLDELTEAQWDRIQAVNVKATALFAQAALPHLVAQPGGSMVNISSIRANLAMPGGLGYDTSKAALLGLTRTLAVELGPQGVRVNAICPGHIMSFGEEHWKQGKSERVQNLMRVSYPLGRVGRPEEVAMAAVFLASEEASFITGQALFVDGGLSIQCAETAVWRAAETL